MKLFGRCIPFTHCWHYKVPPENTAYFYTRTPYVTGCAIEPERTRVRAYTVYYCCHCGKEEWNLVGVN